MTASTPPGSAEPESTPESGAVGRLRAALTAALTGALSARDMIAAAAIRSALAAIGNAEAVQPRPKPGPATGTAPAQEGTHRTPVGSEHIAGAAAGLGAAEAARRQLTEEESPRSCWPRSRTGVRPRTSMTASAATTGPSDCAARPKS